jgi:LmbE family N-acetylglucosaminyl deacetylase
MIARLAELLKRFEPALVFTPFLADRHKDHRTLNAVLAGAILSSGDALANARILGYEVWSLAPASLVCDVTDVREAQEDLLRHYEMGMRVDDFIDLCERAIIPTRCACSGARATPRCFMRPHRPTIPTSSRSPTSAARPPRCRARRRARASRPHPRAGTGAARPAP